MPTSTDGITAFAAVVAAILSALNLIVTGRREEVMWRRSALTEALREYADLSFGMTRAARRAMSLRANGKRRELRDLWKSEAELHQRSTDQLTRIRLLASRRVLRAA